MELEICHWELSIVEDYYFPKNIEWGKEFGHLSKREERGGGGHELLYGSVRKKKKRGKACVVIFNITWAINTECTFGRIGSAKRCPYLNLFRTFSSYLPIRWRELMRRGIMINEVEVGPPPQPKKKHYNTI